MRSLFGFFFLAAYSALYGISGIRRYTTVSNDDLVSSKKLYILATYLTNPIVLLLSV